MTQQTMSVDGAVLTEWVRKILDTHVLTARQSVFLDPGQGVLLVGQVISVTTSSGTGTSGSGTSGQGIVTGETIFEFQSQSPSVVIREMNRSLFKQEFNFEALGIGGLDVQFADIFRRAFASRVYSPALVQELGITHVRGLLLYGPPGTGKTLIARQIGKALKAKEPKIVNGPEVLNKFVGQSEENIRNLFAEAEIDEKKFGINSPLHIIIFDELDAICKQRGSTGASGSGVNDSVVNQLLSKIDGVNSLNNILLIGMTNRMDMLDEALLRPGRLEVQIEIGLPDEFGRNQILKIHTNDMRKSKRMADDVDLKDLAKRTRNFSGAELAGLIRSAVSYAFARNVDPSNLGGGGKTGGGEADVLITKADFEMALKEVRPAFGASEDLDRYSLNGIIPYSAEFLKLRQDLMVLTEQVKKSPSSPLVTVLLWGTQGSGKTSLATHIAKQSNFPFVKIISPNQFVGYNEGSKLMGIAKAFDDAYKSNLSLLIIDDIERLLDFTPIGPRFSNNLLQALLVLVKKIPPYQATTAGTTSGSGATSGSGEGGITAGGRRLLIIGITSEPQFLQDSKLASAFQLAYKQPLIREKAAVLECLNYRRKLVADIDQLEANRIADLVGTAKIGVKKLFMALEMASEMSKPQTIKADTAVQCLRDFGVNI
ncbi:putative N-ethylmaleimide sensitive protein [Gregarina niphandrodes]|uniref:Vesicle-fusing ATPase n=1 Tax=Gregarina niphandrodes TaxID=110365 RepID=A0A023B2G5_GRENI|nr:putative N-ethylmaleimide sensitive protein [Gregarina niphandrodes]EZG52949.1 putative N-ethylmaleimide sensitive protein [Gregarina niphandrodes]|eukprot:XP_011131880.1 putative N-ethylmaleimide sensitive protein [Gregarina niphandrodes]